MPLYTYRCQNEECKHSEDKIVKYDERENVQYDCAQCGTEQNLKFEAFTPGSKGSNLYFRGNFFANTGGY